MFVSYEVDVCLYHHQPPPPPTSSVSSPVPTSGFSPERGCSTRFSQGMRFLARCRFNSVDLGGFRKVLRRCSAASRCFFGAMKHAVHMTIPLSPHTEHRHAPRVSRLQPGLSHTRFLWSGFSHLTPPGPRLYKLRAGCARLPPAAAFPLLHFAIRYWLSFRSQTSFSMWSTRSQVSRHLRSSSFVIPLASPDTTTVSGRLSGPIFSNSLSILSLVNLAHIPRKRKVFVMDTCSMESIFRRQNKPFGLWSLLCAEEI